MFEDQNIKHPLWRLIFSNQPHASLLAAASVTGGALPGSSARRSQSAMPSRNEGHEFAKRGYFCDGGKDEEGNNRDTCVENDVTLVISSISNHSREDIPSFNHQGRYEFICDFAAGGMGNISKLKDLIFERYVAGKTVKPELTSRPEILQGFVSESKLMARLDHPGIVPVYSIGTDQSGSPQLIMKLINGVSLEHFIEDARKDYGDLRVAGRLEPMRLKDRLEYIFKVCDVIEYAHSMKIVHGDIKPENILLGKFGETYVMDWGCAGHTGSTRDHLSGTPLYLPPEYLQTRTISEGVDVFAIGVLLYEMVTLRRLREDTVRSSVKLVSAAESGNLIPLHYFPEIKIPNNLLAIIGKAVAADPVSRYQSVADLRMDLRRFIYNEEVSAAPDSLFQKLFRMIDRNRMRSVLVLLLLILLLLGGWFATSYRNWLKEEKMRGDFIHELQMQIGAAGILLDVTKKLTQAQSQLLIFADNLVEDINEPCGTGKTYGNDDFASPLAAPPDLMSSDYYSQKISLGAIVRLNDSAVPAAFPRPDSKQMVKLCRKVIYYDRNSSALSNSAAAGNFLLTPGNMIQHLFVIWSDNITDVYPGRFINQAKRKDFKSLEALRDQIALKTFFWTPFFYGQNVKLRLICMYSMFDYNNRFIGLAGLELRADVIFEALIKANQESPLNEFFIVSVSNQVMTADTDKLYILEGERRTGNGFDAAKILELKKRIAANGMNQIEIVHNGRNFRIAAYKGVTLHSTIINVVDTAAFADGGYKYGSM